MALRAFIRVFIWQVASLAAASVALPAGAQGAGGSGWLIEGHAGGWWPRPDSRPNVAADGGPGMFVGLRAGRVLGGRSSDGRLRVVASAGYGRLGSAYTEITTRANDDVLTATHRSEFVPVTAGAEYDLVSGPTALAVGLEAGALWSREPVVRRTGPPPFFERGDAISREWGRPGATVLPSLTFRRRLTPGVDASLSLRGVWGKLGGALSGDALRPTLAAGVAWWM